MQRSIRLACIAMLVGGASDIIATVMTEDPTALQTVGVRAALTAAAALAGISTDTKRLVFRRMTMGASALLATAEVWSLAVLAGRLVLEPSLIDSVLLNVATQALTVVVALRAAYTAKN
jgi:hypothetical protein